MEKCVNFTKLITPHSLFKNVRQKRKTLPENQALFYHAHMGYSIYKDIPAAKVAPEDRWLTSTLDDVTAGFAVPDMAAGSWSIDGLRVALLTILL